MERKKDKHSKKKDNWDNNEPGRKNKPEKAKKKFNPFQFNPFDVESLIKNLFNFPEFQPDAIRRINPDNLKNQKGYSISYKFGTGMKKPEIKINGEPMDEETAKNIFDMMKNLPMDMDKMGLPMMPFGDMDEKDIFNALNAFGLGNLSQTEQPIALDAKELSNEDNKSIDSEVKSAHSLPKEIPFSEIVIDEDGNNAEITIEMPTVERDRINISIFGKKVIISGESESHWFEKSYDLAFKPDPNKTLIDGRNGIYVITLNA